MQPRPLTNLFMEKYVERSYPDLLVKSEKLFHTLKITPAQAKGIEDKTKKSIFEQGVVPTQG